MTWVCVGISPIFFRTDILHTIVLVCMREYLHILVCVSLKKTVMDVITVYLRTNLLNCLMFPPTRKPNKRYISETRRVCPQTLSDIPFLHVKSAGEKYVKKIIIANKIIRMLREKTKRNKNK